jgi:hypothetical protein
MYLDLCCVLGPVFLMPARVPHPGGFQVLELTGDDLNRPMDMKGMIQVNRVVADVARRLVLP